MACLWSTNWENGCHYINGITKWGGGTSPTLPHGEIAPVLKRSINNGIRNKLSKRLQDDALEKIRCRGNAESKFSPLYWPFKKGWKKSCTLTQFLIHSKILGVRSNGAMLAMRSQAGKWLSWLPATKESGSLKVSMETSARAWPLITSSTNWDAICVLPSAIPWATSRGEPSKLTQRTEGLITLVGSKCAVISHSGMVGEAPSKRLEGGWKKRKKGK